MVQSILITSAGNLLYFLVDFRQLGLLNVIINCAVLQRLNHFCDQAPHNYSPDTFCETGLVINEQVIFMICSVVLVY